jgi:hypothetical protein
MFLPVNTSLDGSKHSQLNDIPPDEYAATY